MSRASACWPPWSAQNTSVITPGQDHLSPATRGATLWLIMNARHLAGLGLGLTIAGVGVVMLAQTSPKSSPVTFHKDVLPILQKNCQSCHRPGQIAPMSLL